MKTCVRCDCALDQYQFACHKGPFCPECFEALCDPDLALMLEDRVARLEAKVIQLKADLAASDVIIARLRSR